MSHIRDHFVLELQPIQNYSGIMQVQSGGLNLS